MNKGDMAQVQAGEYLKAGDTIYLSFNSKAYPVPEGVSEWEIRPLGIVQNDTQAEQWADIELLRSISQGVGE